MKNPPSMNDNNTIVDCIQHLMDDKTVRRATAYRSPKLVVKATRLHKDSARAQYATFVVTIGVPNFEQRAWIKQAIKAKEPFPVKKVQLQKWPVKRKPKTTRRASKK